MAQMIEARTNTSNQPKAIATAAKEIVMTIPPIQQLSEVSLFFMNTLAG